jgi:hypothetical protein
MVKRNKERVDPLLPCLVAIAVQLIATAYLYSVHAPIKSVIASGVLTSVYVLVTYLLNKKPNRKKAV